MDMKSASFYLISTEALLAHSEHEQLLRMHKTLGTPLANLTSQETIRVARDIYYDTVSREALVVANESLAGVISLGLFLTGIMTVGRSMSNFLVRIKTDKIHAKYGDTKLVERLDDAIKNVQSERKKTGVVDKVINGNHKKALEKVVQEIADHLRYLVAKGELTESEKAHALKLLDHYELTVRKEHHEGNAEETIDPELDIEEECGDISSEEMDPLHKMAISLGLNVVSTLGVALAIKTFIRSRAKKSQIRHAEGDNTEEKLKSLLDTVNHERKRDGFLESRLFKTARTSAIAAAKQGISDLKKLIISGELTPEQESRVKELITKAEKELKYGRASTEAYLQNVAPDETPLIGLEEYSSEEMDRETKKAVRRTSTAAIALGGSILAIVGLNRLAQNRHMRKTDKELEGKSTADKVRETLDEIRDKDIHGDIGWFGNKLTALERIARREVDILKQAIREKTLTGKELVHAKEVLEKYRKVMTRRYHNNAMTDAISHNAQARRANAVSGALQVAGHVAGAFLNH